MSLVAIAAATAASVAFAQQAPEPAPPATGNSAHSLRLPENPQVFGQAMPSVIKATAIVNGDVITGNDVDQRLALLAISQGTPIPADEIDRLRQQVLRNLIDETLEIQAAKTEKIEVKKSDIDRTVARVATGVKQTPEQFAAFLEQNGSSIASIRRQIEGEIAWTRLQQRKIESGVSVGDDEVKAVLDRMNASKGTEEYKGRRNLPFRDAGHPGADARQRQQDSRAAQERCIVPGYARQYSEASTAAVGGDLGWVRPEQLPAPLASAIRGMVPGAISEPIPVPGGFSILSVQDTRKILTAEPRDAVLSLKQISVAFPKGTTRQQAEPIVARFTEAARNIGGCGGADKLAANFHGEIVSSDQTKLRDLPPFLQNMMLPMQVGQATQPFGSIDEGVRVLVICGRDEVDPSQPTYDEVYNQLNDERVNIRARRYLRDLRQDAVIEFR
jgi:Parvulin-like peptidyl-prolyl isomerase